MSGGKELRTIVSMYGQIDPSLKKSIASAQKSITGLKAKLVTIGKVSLVGVAGGMTALAVATAKCAESAIDYEKQMANVGTLLDGDVKKRVAELGKDVIKVSNETGTATSDLTEGLYQVISAFGDNEESIERLKIASKAAKAGNASTADSINLLSGVTKGYGDTSAKAMSKAADLAFMTAKLGQTTFPELAASMGKTIPLANALGVKEEELFGTFATLTGVTGNTAEVATQTQGVLKGFLSPTKEMADITKKLGYENGQAMLKSLGFQGALTKLKESVGGNDLAMAKLFSDVPAQTALLSLMGKQAKDLTEKTKAMFESSGAAGKAYAAQTDNFHDQWGKLLNIFKNIQTQIGTKLLPYLRKMVDSLLPHVNRLVENLDVYLDTGVDKAREFFKSMNFSGIISPLKEVWDYMKKAFGFVLDNKDTIVEYLKIIGIAFLAYQGTVIGLTVAQGAMNAALFLQKVYFVAVRAGIMAYNAVLLVIRGATVAWTAVQWALNAAMTANPIGIIIVAIGALIAGIIALIVYWDDVMAALKTANQWMTDTFGNWKYLILALISPVTSIAVLIIDHWDEICSFFTSAWKAVCDMFEAAPALFSVVADKIKTALVGAFTSVYTWVTSIVDGIMKRFTDLFDGILSAGSKIKEWGNAALSAANPMNWLPAKAAGGFVNGPSLCGEAGTEAVISFDPRYRDQNRGYLMTAAEMLGMAASPAETNSRQNVVHYDLGGITFSPVIKTGGQGEAGKDIIRQIRAAGAEFADMIEELLRERENARYGV